MMLGLYLKSLLIATLIVGFACFLWLIGRLLRRVDKTKQERQVIFYDMIMVMIVTIPIVAFGVLAVLMMIQI